MRRIKHKRVTTATSFPLLRFYLLLLLIMSSSISTITQVMSKAYYQPPNSLSTDPICHLVEPGNCQLTKEWTSCRLIERIQVSPTSYLLRFQLPDKGQPLNLSTCACILARTTDPKFVPDVKEDNDDTTTTDTTNVIRPYTPISTNALVGCFDLLVKDYGTNAKMSHTLTHRLEIGGGLEFSHSSDANVKIQAPFPQSHILLIAGGTGITPILQALHAILGEDTSSSADTAASEKKDKQKIVLLYGSKTEEDILARSLLDRWASRYPQLTVEYVLSDEPADDNNTSSSSSSSRQGRRGFIDEALIQQYLPAASVGNNDDNLLVMVCGPPPLYNAICGPREDKDQVLGVLGKLGLTVDQVYKF